MLDPQIPLGISPQPRPQAPPVQGWGGPGQLPTFRAGTVEQGPVAGQPPPDLQQLLTLMALYQLIQARSRGAKGGGFQLGLGPGR